MRPSILADGIGFQLTGELLLDRSSSPEERSKHRSIYLRSLEDTAFLIVFSPSLGVAGAMPKMRDDTPGTTLLDYVGSLIGEDSIVQRSQITVPTVAEVVAIDMRRASIVNQLSKVGAAFNVSRDDWHSVLRREATGFLGSDPSVLRDSFLTSQSLVFERPGGYLDDPSMTEVVDEACVSKLTDRLTGLFPRHHPSALRQFVLRFLLTHFAISEAYDYVAEQSGAFRMPFVTRADVRRLAKSPPAHRTGKILDLTRDALDIALRKMGGDSRERVIERLVDLRDGRQYRIYRSMIRDYIEAVGGGHDGEGRQILEGLNAAYESASISDMMIDSIHRSGSFLRCPTGGTQYPETLYRVFPELIPVEGGGKEMDPKTHISISGSGTVNLISKSNTGNITSVSNSAQSPQSTDAIAPERGDTVLVELAHQLKLNTAKTDELLAAVRTLTIELDTPEPDRGKLALSLDFLREILTHSAAIGIAHNVHDWLPALVARGQAALDAIGR